MALQSMDERARISRLIKITRYLRDLIEEDWDQPHVHELRRVIGWPERDQHEAAEMIDQDLIYLLELLGIRAECVS